MASEINNCSVAVRRLSVDRVVPQPTSVSTANAAASAVRAMRSSKEQTIAWNQPAEFWPKENWPPASVRTLAGQTKVGADYSGPGSTANPRIPLR